MNKLLIVESPNKAKKIKSYLSDDWVVAASAGHIRDMPGNYMAVEAPDYNPDYEVIKDKKATVERLKSLAMNAKEVWLATDPDREGEAIAWHIGQVIGSKNKTCHRITFHEITKPAIQKAITTPRKVDMDLVMAQQGRRVLDRLFGYKVSPVLSRALSKGGLSAGRVQSVALRLIVEREEQIRAFAQTKHFGVAVAFDGAHGQWTARWQPGAPLVTDDQPYVLDRGVADAVLHAAQHGLIVSKYQEKEQARKPPAPFTTSTLQQAAANRLGMSVDDAMKAAQSLFESGLITYHRTDNPNLSDEGIEAIWALLRERGQDAYIPPKANVWKSKDGAQEAHEAIRPTDFRISKNPRTGNDLYDKLYRMIWLRATASQMADAVFKVRIAELVTANALTELPDEAGKPQKALFAARGETRIFDGWQKIADGDYTHEHEQEDDDEAQSLPQLSRGEEHIPTAGKVLELETRAPKRYSEPGLVKALEREGIGRPSTYASIITILQKRGYVEIVKRFFHPTELGEVIIDGLRNRFSFLEVAYTREMESELDRIAAGKGDYRAIVGHYDQELDEQITSFMSESGITAMPGGMGGETHPCPNCDDGRLRRIKGSNGYFWGCSNYRSDPPCKTTLPDAQGKPGKRPEKSMEYPCPACGEGYLQRRAGKKKNSWWWGCDRYPQCKHTEKDVGGKPQCSSCQ